MGLLGGKILGGSGGYAALPEDEWNGGIGDAQTGAQRDFEIHQADRWRETVAAGDEPMAVKFGGGVQQVRSTPTGVVEVGPTMTTGEWDSMTAPRQPDRPPSGGLLGAMFMDQPAEPTFTTRDGMIGARGLEGRTMPAQVRPAPPPRRQVEPMADRPDPNGFSMRFARGLSGMGRNMVSDRALKGAIARARQDEQDLIAAQLAEQTRRAVADRERQEWNMDALRRTVLSHWGRNR